MNRYIIWKYCIKLNDHNIDRYRLLRTLQGQNNKKRYKYKQNHAPLPHEKLTGIKRLKFYQKCLTSQKYLSFKCKTHRLHKHIITNKTDLNTNDKDYDKKNENMSLEFMSAFLLSIIGAIYLDSNLYKQEEETLNNMIGKDLDELIPNDGGYQLEYVWKFIE